MDQSANNKRIAKNTLMRNIGMFFTVNLTLFSSGMKLPVLCAENCEIRNLSGE